MTDKEFEDFMKSFIKAAQDNKNLYDRHKRRDSTLTFLSDPNAFNKKDGTPVAKQDFGYKATKDVSIPNKGVYRSLQISCKLLSSGRKLDTPTLYFLNKDQNQKANNGIYPLFDYDTADDKLILIYGTSNENPKPKPNWCYSPDGDKLDISPEKGKSHYYKTYKNVSTHLLNYKQMLSDLDDVIDDYEITLGTPHTPRTDGKPATGTGNVLPPTGFPAPVLTPATPAPKTPAPAPYHSLNLILYGPPGTGKTYNTLFHALAVINGLKVKQLEDEAKDQDDRRKSNPKEPSGYKYIKDKYHYDKLVDSGQIVFTTFHQSMSYEDFIEGIKPIAVDTDVVATHNNNDPKSKVTQFGDGSTRIANLSRMKYEVKDGIFKKICEKAEKAKICYWIDCFVQSVEGEKNKIPLKTTKQKRAIEVWHEKDSASLTVLPKGSKAKDNQTISIDLHLKKPILEEDIERILEGNLEGNNNWPSYTPAVIDHIIKKYKNEKDLKYPPYVLIIDEINRGNVAQIFGELITLIEPSKRLGNSEEMKAILPYSSAQKGEPEYFGVPNNLYIIGTMNTADRSVEALDTALRRRFFFEEMMPDKSLLTGVCGVDLGLLLETINKRIVALKDREHQIGHSYFMGHDDKKEDGRDKYPDKEKWLTNVFKDKIIPLLQEYFYGDYKKIYYVLGPGFVEKKTEKTIFAVENPDYDEFDIPEERYDIVSFEGKFSIEEAIKEMKVQKSDIGTAAMSVGDTKAETAEA